MLRYCHPLATTMLHYYLLICLVIVLSSKSVKPESSPGIDSAAGQDLVTGQESVPGRERVIEKEIVIGQESVPGQKSLPDDEDRRVKTKYVQALNPWLFDNFLLYLKCLFCYFVFLGVVFINIQSLVSYVPADVVSDFLMYKIFVYTVSILTGISLAVGAFPFIFAVGAFPSPVIGYTTIYHVLYYIFEGCAPPPPFYTYRHHSVFNTLALH